MEIVYMIKLKTLLIIIMRIYYLFILIKLILIYYSEPSIKSIEDIFEENNGQQQYFSVTLGVGPLWWS